MSKAPVLENRRILIAEDEYYVADELAKAVRLFGGTVLGPVGTQREALALLASEDATVAIVDIVLQEETAYPLVQELIARNVPLVFATGLATEDILPPYRDLPRWVKPYLPLALVATLKHVN